MKESRIAITNAWHIWQGSGQDTCGAEGQQAEDDGDGAVGESSGAEGDVLHVSIVGGRSQAGELGAKFIGGK